MPQHSQTYILSRNPDAELTTTITFGSISVFRETILNASATLLQQFLHPSSSSGSIHSKTKKNEKQRRGRGIIFLEQIIQHEIPRNFCNKERLPQTDLLTPPRTGCDEAFQSSHTRKRVTTTTSPFLTIVINEYLRESIYYTLLK